jgi:hypothetical protein
MLLRVLQIMAVPKLGEGMLALAAIGKPERELVSDVLKALKEAEERVLPVGPRVLRIKALKREINGGNGGEVDPLIHRLKRDARVLGFWKGDDLGGFQEQETFWRKDEEKVVKVAKDDADRKPSLYGDMVIRGLGADRLMLVRS